MDDHYRNGNSWHVGINEMSESYKIIRFCILFRIGFAIVNNFVVHSYRYYAAEAVTLLQRTLSAQT